MQIGAGFGACSRDWGPLQRQWGRPVAVQPFWCRSETSRLVAQAELWALATALLGFCATRHSRLAVQSAVMKPCGPCAALPHTKGPRTKWGLGSTLRTPRPLWATKRGRQGQHV